VGAGIKIVLAGLMSVASFGVYSFSVAFLQFTALWFEFGLFLPAARRVAKAQDDAKRSFVGAAIALFGPIGLGFVATVAVLGLFVDSIFDVGAGRALLLSAPLAFVYPFSYVAFQLSQATDRLDEYALTSLVGQLAILAMLTVVWGLAGHTTATVALLIRAAGLGIGGAILLYRMRPLFQRVTERWRIFAREARDYGFEAYLGRVLSIGTYNMDVLMVGAFVDAQAVALYALAGSLAAVSGLPVVGFARSLFRRMTDEPHLRRDWLVLAWAVGIVTALLAWRLSGPFLDLFFSSGYHDAVKYVAPLALAQVVRGVTDVYNSFLAARGQGRHLRNAGLVLTVSNLALNFLLIPPFGAMGAAWASLAALLANYAAHVYGYRRYLRDPQQFESHPVPDPQIIDPQQ
jgi:O-antigen/teichoic acid export membrane protein